MNHIKLSQAEFEQKLTDEFPKMFRQLGESPDKSCMAFGVCIGPGWRDMFYKLCQDIAATNPDDDFQFDQVKEKFAELRAYVSGSSDEIDELIDAAEKASVTICECCGTTEGVTVEGRWLTAKCPTCRNLPKEPANG